MIAREEVIASRIAAGLDRTDAPVAAAERMVAAIADTETSIGWRLAGEQRRAVEAICSSGRGEHRRLPGPGDTHHQLDATRRRPPR